MSLFGTRTSSPFFGEFAPMFRLMDDYASHIATRDGHSSSSSSSLPLSKSLKTFQPKFDVKENKETYELFGELPGIEQKNVQIEFTDAQTLSIKGRTEHHYRVEGKEGEEEEGSRAMGLVGGSGEQGKITATEGEAENGYQKASVVEEESGQTPSSITTTTGEQQSEKSTTGQVSNTKPTPATNPSSRYWLSERSIGEFARTFAFPTRIDQENVRASLKDGILSIVIPKAAAPVSRRIQIE